MSVFSERFHQLRLNGGLTQLQLAEILHTTQRRISYFETGKIEPDLKTLYEIAVYFGVSADYLIGLNEY